MSPVLQLTYSAHNMDTIKYSNGVEMLMIGLSTFGATKENIHDALCNGIRSIDSALAHSMSQVEIVLGEAIREAMWDTEIQRTELFIMSKLYEIFVELALRFN